jgi:hypothetical protein
MWDFFRRACQGFNKSAGNKIICKECVWEQESIIQSNKFPHQNCPKKKNISYSLIKFLIKTVKDEK